MKIALDARMYHESGIGRYIRNLIENLLVLDKINQYFILLNKDNYDTLVYHKNFKKVLADFRWYGIDEQIKLPKLLNKLKPDLVHFPHFNVPIFYKGKFVVTIHDLIHQHYSMQRSTTHGALIYKIKQLGYKNVFRHAIEKSDKILVPSNFIKKQLIQGWRVDSSKIIVTPEAVDDKIPTAVAKMSTIETKKILKKLNIKQPYIFYVGNAHPHKNVEGLIRIFRELRGKYPNLQLVLSGYDHYFWQRLRHENQYKGIIYTGYVDDEQLVALYKNALCFVMPSYEEGFGIPLLEAMECGCPVVSSNAGALTEVGGNACLYFDPASPDDMGDKIERVLKKKSLRNQLIERGQKRVRLFNWEKLAKQTLEVYNQCVLP